MYRLLDFKPDLYRYPSDYHEESLLYLIGIGESSGDDVWQWRREAWIDGMPTAVGIDYSRSRLIDLVASETSGNAADRLYHREFGDVFERCLQEHLPKHGLFALEFAARQFLEEARPEIDTLLEELISASEPDNHKFSRSTFAGGIPHVLVDQFAFNHLKDKELIRLLSRWREEHSKETKCCLCGDWFRVIDLPYWAYRDSGGLTDFCHRCELLERPLKGELADRISEFVDACGFISAGHNGPFDRSWVARVSPERWEPAVRAWARTGGTEWVKKKYGSWFAALAKSGVLPDGVLPTARGVRCLAPDGHTCHSLEEQSIDAWLSDRGIPHEREPKYPEHPTWNPSGRRRADWQVGETFVEYFGLTGDKDYDKKTAEKLTLARVTGIELLAVYPKDLANLDEALSVLDLIV